MKPTFLKSILLGGVAVLLLAWNASAQDAEPVAASTNAAGATNLVSTDEGTSSTSFSIISRRNIFNPNRSERSTSRRSGSTARTDTFTLLGTMSYEKGRFAIFDGTDSEYRHTLKVADQIAGYRIAEINTDAVKLIASSNRFITLPVGTQMRRPQGGRWSVAGQVDSMAPDVAQTPGDTNAPASGDTHVTPYPPPDGAAPSGASRGGDDAIRRMMERRASEK